MLHYRVILLVLISFEISSCAFNPRILKFRKNKTERTATAAAVFSADGSSAVYTTKVDFYKFHFSGLIAIKRNAASNYDVAMISEMGMTLMKMKYINGKYQDVNVLEELNRPVVINLIQEDLAMLMIDETAYRQKWLSQRGDNTNVLKLKKKRQTPYFVYYKDNNISRIDKADAAGKKVSVNFLSYENEIPTEFHLKHYGLKNARLIFKQLKQEKKEEDEYDVEE